MKIINATPHDMFPSPYGVTVIKSAYKGDDYDKAIDVSVPLRGNGN